MSSGPESSEASLNDDLRLNVLSKLSRDELIGKILSLENLEKYSTQNYLQSSQLPSEQMLCNSDNSPSKFKGPELDKNRELLIYMNDILSDGYWDWKIDENYQYMSPQFWRMFGYDPGEKKHRPEEWQKIINKEDLALTMDNFRLHVESKGSYPYEQEVRYQHYDGSTIWVHCKGKVVEWGDEGEPVRMIGTHTNITSLRESIERYELMEDGASVGIWEWKDIQKSEMHWSRKFFELLGYYYQEIKPSFEIFKDLVDSEYLNQVMSLIKEHIGSKESLEVDMMFVCKSGERKWFKLRGQYSASEDGSVKRMVGSIQDINATKNLQKSLESMNEELEQFAYRTSHDLKSPLTTNINLLKFIKEDLEKGDLSEVKYNLDKVISNNQSLATLITDIMELSKADLADLNLEVLRIKDIEGWLKTIDFENVELESNVDLSLEYRCYRVRVQQIIVNLLSNAVKYADLNKNGQWVKFKCESSGKGINISVHDNGIGIPVKQQSKVFGMFQRLHGGYRSGHGLGLAIVKKHVDKLNGKIEFNSDTEGTRFSVWLPKF